jgi:hypothetical protein
MAPTLQNFIDGAFAPAAAGQTEPVLKLADAIEEHAG